MSESPGPVPQRIGDAERDQATTYLREAMAQGRLDQAEFDERVEAALRAKTQADLDPLFRDLPGPRPGQAIAPDAGFNPPPWQQPTADPTSQVAVPAAAGAPAKRSSLSKTIDTIAWVIWPVTLIVLFATNWHYWWLIFIPIIVSSYAGKRRHDENDQQRQIGGR